MKLQFLLIFLGSFLFVFSFSKVENFEKFINFQKKDNQASRKTDFDKAEYFFSKKNWDSTIIYTSKTIRISKQQNVLYYCHYLRGCSYMKKELYGEALKEFDALPESFYLYNKILRYYAGIALEQKKFNEAICYFNILKKHPNYNTEKYYVLNGLGVCYLHLKAYKKAEVYLSQFTALPKKDTLSSIGMYSNIANLYYIQYKDNQAIPYFEKAYHLSQKTNNHKLRRTTSKNMAVVEENRKNFAKSLIYRKEFEQWSDSLHKQNKIKGIAELNNKHAVEQKQKQIQLLEVENKAKIMQRNGFIIFSVLLFLLLSTGLYFYIQKNRANKLILSQKEELSNLNTTKNQLLSVIGHDLRSSVHALNQSNTKLLKNIDKGNFESLGSTARKSTVIGRSTYNLLENLLHWATLQTHQLYFSIESINLHAVMQQVTYDYQPLFEHKNLIFKNTIPEPTFVTADLDSLKVVIRNILDNAIKFSKKEGTITTYTYTTMDEYLYFVIEDTGIGMDTTTREALLTKGKLLNKKKDQKGIGTGLGIRLCISMIQKNKGKLQIESTPDTGTKMIIALPKSVENG